MEIPNDGAAEPPPGVAARVDATGITPKKENHSRPPLSPSNVRLHSSVPTRTLSHGDDDDGNKKRRRRTTTAGASYLRSMSTSILGGHRRQLSNERASSTPAVDNRSVEEKRLNRIITETGEDAWGIDAIEVWLLESDQSGRLIRPDGGYWRNPDMSLDEFLSRLEDASNPMHIPAEPVLVGVDLPGNLWAESSEGPYGVGNNNDGILNLSKRGGNLFGYLNSRPPTPSASNHGGNFFGNRERAGSTGSSTSGRAGKVFSGGSLKGGDVFAALSQAMGKKSSSPRQKDNDPTASEHEAKDGDEKAGTADGDKSQQLPLDTENISPPKQKEKPGHRRGSTWGSFSQSFDPRNRLRLPKFGQQQRAGDQDNHGQPHLPRAMLHWRDIGSLVDDPDTAKTPRLNAIHNAGFNHAAGVTFAAGNQRGMVIFLTQLQEDAEQLIDYYNQVSMIRNAEAIGAVIAANEARKAAMATRPDGFLAGGSGAAIDGKDDTHSDDFWAKITMWSRKCIGGGSLQIPPSATFHQSMFSFFGCLCSLLLLGSVSDAIHINSDGELFFFMAPIGALMALEFGLTAAPASQPRSAFYGQVVGGAISLGFSYIPMTVWVRQAIASSLAISMMGKLGVLHPPAGAASILLASGQFGWKHYGLLLAATIVSLIPAVLINNCSVKRQYPTHSWRAMVF